MRLFVASSTAIFGETPQSPQREDSECRPTSPYAIAKLAAHQISARCVSATACTRARGSSTITSPSAGPRSSSRARSRARAAAIKLGLQEELHLGDIEAVRDWSFAGDIMRAAWLSLQQESARDYVLASGVGRTVREFAEVAFNCVGLEAERYLRVDPTLVRAPR